MEKKSNNINDFRASAFKASPIANWFGLGTSIFKLVNTGKAPMGRVIFSLAVS